MRRFIIERDIPDIGSAEREQLRAAAGQSNSVLRAMQSEGKAIQWEHSYVAGDKTFCVYVCDEPGLIDEHSWARMKEHFTDQQILELLTLIGYCVAMGRTMAILDIANDCTISRTPDPAEDPSHYIHG